MNRRLWLIELLLIGVIVFTAHQLRQRMQEAERREQALLRQMIPAAPPPVIPPLPVPGPTQAGQYNEVAQQMLFVRERNPNIVLDPPPAPPPPKPMPSLPFAYGVVNLGQGPTAILSEKSGAPHRPYRAGEKIGEFKVYALNTREIIFEWDGKYIKKRYEELVDKRVNPQTIPPEAQPAAAAAASSGNTPQTTMLGSTAKPAGPSAVEMGNSARACQPGDTAAAGTVQDGFRKVVVTTPFGQSCRWEPVR